LNRVEWYFGDETHIVEASGLHRVEDSEFEKPAVNIRWKDR